MYKSSAFKRWLIPACLAVFLAGCASGPPVQEMSDARQAIAAVGETERGSRAAELLTQARSLLESAEEKLRRSAFNGARVDALEARRKAMEALEEMHADDQRR